LIDAVQDVITWLGRIKVPKIDLPFGIGKAAAPSGGASGTLTPFGAATGGSSSGGPSGGVVINIYGDPASIQASVIRALRTYARRNGLAPVAG
jgi:hypothetical protein